MFLYIPLISLILTTHCKWSWENSNVVIQNWFFTIVIWSMKKESLPVYPRQALFQNHITEISDKDWGHTQICRCLSRWKRAIFSFLQRKVYFILSCLGIEKGIYHLPNSSFIIKYPMCLSFTHLFFCLELVQSTWCDRS